MFHRQTQRVLERPPDRLRHRTRHPRREHSGGAAMQIARYRSKIGTGARAVTSLITQAAAEPA